jgi:hypothetical protein
VWRTGFGRGCGLVVRQTAEWMNVILITLRCATRRARKNAHGM